MHARFRGNREGPPALPSAAFQSHFCNWLRINLVGKLQPRKFDTLFYLVRGPAGDWNPHPQEGECVAAEWANPTSLLERIDRGEASAIFPTKRNLERLAQHDWLESALADARSHSIETIIPWVEDIDGEPHVRIPEGRGYPVISEPLATAFRA